MCAYKPIYIIYGMALFALMFKETECAEADVEFSPDHNDDV